MRVLWVTNVLPAPGAELAGHKPSPYGGWLQGSLQALREFSDLRLTIAAPGPSHRMLGVAAGVEYRTFPTVRRRAASAGGLAEAAAAIAGAKPDLLHIHGTEMPHALTFAVQARHQSLPTVVSIQGLTSVYAKHMRAHLPTSIVHKPGRRPWVRGDRVAGLQRSFAVQGRIEIATLRIARDVIGRTTWDCACVGQINPKVRYHHCDETLRPGFYGQPWKYDPSRPRRIFVGQAHYPIKGLHLLLEALPEILDRFPGTQVEIAGQRPVVKTTPSPYAKYISRQIRVLRLDQAVSFLGPQNEQQMLACYRRSSVVVCPSVIENSPNGVAEAMLLGIPVVAAHVGGVPNMITNGVDGWTYQADAPYMLADTVERVFSEPETSAAMAAAARARALARHDPQTNARRTMAIYIDVVKRAVS
jgi:glycosyltransferase involved in cell wall biosynthesis